VVTKRYDDELDIFRLVAQTGPAAGGVWLALLLARRQVSCCT
jgi:hypothetical protein